MSDDLDGFDMMLLQKFSPRATTTTVRGRKKAEKKSPADKRTLRRTGRTAQFNIRCQPEFKHAIEQQAAERGMLMVEIIEQAFALWLQQNGAPNEA